ncbi:hypothetical protein HY416_00450 [Candidatus Kaiserbacteria bacterium]|nr:hypothetical protein [Candidatus Kaiserbacteria bacterium]
MTINELLKKPIEIMLENNVSDDIVQPSDVVSKLLERVARFSDQSALDFLIVYADKVDGNYSAKAVITHKELSALLDLVQAPNNAEKTVQELDLEAKFPLRYWLHKNDPIEKAYNLFKADLTDTIIILDEKEIYVGKVKRNPFVERLKILLS